MNRDEEQQLCEAYYRRAIAGTTSDEDELAVALDLLEKARNGFVVNDDGSGLMYISDLDPSADADYLVEGPSAGQRLRRALPAVLILVLGLAAVLFLYGDWGKGEPPTATPTTATSVVIRLPTMTLTPTPTRPVTETPTNTPTAAPTPQPTETPTPVAPKAVEVKPEPVKLDADAVALLAGTCHSDQDICSSTQPEDR